VPAPKVALVGVVCQDEGEGEGGGGDEGGVRVKRQSDTQELMATQALGV
jgi:hypothetical protein